MCFIHKPMTTWTTFAVTLRRTYVLSLAVILGPTRNNGKSRAPSASSGFTQPFATSTPFPPVHNSPDTECAYHRQCTDDEFVGLLESLQRQWGLTPEWLRSKCVANYTYPSIEDCILNQTVSWLNTHPHEQAPWINIDVFQPKTTQ